jgi:hypothetical protein
VSPILESIGSVKGFGWGALLASSSFESIQTVTGTGSSGVITFSSIPSTYKSLQIRYMSKDTNANNGILNPKIQFNSDTGNNYAYHELRGNGTSTDANAGYSYSGVLIMGSSLRESSASSIMGVALVDILDYASTTKNKTVRYIGGTDTNGAVDQRISLGSGLWINTDAVTSISIEAGVNNFTTTSTFALYGIKG